MTMLSGLIGAGGKMKTQEFLSGTFTWVKPPSVESIYIFAVAGGGGGAGWGVGGGGGAGAIIEGYYTVTDDVTITVGEGGLGGQSYRSSGANGDNTTFTGGLELTVPGGGGGGGEAENGKDGGCGGGGGGRQPVDIYDDAYTGGGGGGMGSWPAEQPPWIESEWGGKPFGMEPGFGIYGSGGGYYAMGAPGYMGFAAGGTGIWLDSNEPIGNTGAGAGGSVFSEYNDSPGEDARENSGSGGSAGVGDIGGNGGSGYVKIMWIE